jgi:hypothetical protein
MGAVIGVNAFGGIGKHVRRARKVSGGDLLDWSKDPIVGRKLPQPSGAKQLVATGAPKASK